MTMLDKLFVLVASAFAMNLPLGYLRQGTRKFSFAWFLYVHLSIPFIILIRVYLGVSMWYIPLSISTAVAGQLVGGRFRKTGTRR